MLKKMVINLTFPGGELIVILPGVSMAMYPKIDGVYSGESH